jgi:hypothetical protein
MLTRRRLTRPLVEAWFDLLPPGQQALARELHGMILALAPDLDQSVRSGHLVYGVERQHVLALAPHRQHLHLQIFAGSALATRFPALEGSGPGLRQLRLRYAQPVDVDGVGALVAAAVRAAPARRSGPPPGHGRDGTGGADDSGDPE